ncbi:RGG repeats nuclear RNA binding protein A-like isoform X2 [Phragmites australis]|uniref:RGG repeats nuclear RNA binding protein A-like isoform X2 n=1 Tax=Phragmites australis TaxID=29695 RepID=UPI002D77F6B8|nr:RGG repeats nuclear RNA binding protein A-like isoform X2 [Phragmites australis]
MASRNQFDLLGDVDNDDPSQLIAAAEKKAAASPRPPPAAPAPAKPPTKSPPPAQAVREARNYGAPPRDTAGRGGPGRGRGVRGGRTGPRRDFGNSDANGFEGGYGGRFGDERVARGENGEGRQAERDQRPRQPYRGGGRHGGYTDGQDGDESGHPRRAYERHSGTGRGYEMKREGAGRGNWGTVTDEGLAQDAVDAVNAEEPAAVVEDEKKPEDAPQSEVEKDKKGVENEEEEKEPEDKEMTLEEYEKVLEEKRKALHALKAEERKVEIDNELQSMQQLSVKKDADEVFIKLGSDKDSKKKENAERDERTKKSLSINEFLKPAEGERYYNPGGRGRGRGRGHDRGRGERGGFRGGYNGGYRGPAAAPVIEDPSQFPTLGGK